MVKFKGQVDSQGHLYIPQEIRAELNTKDLEMLGNAKAILVYPRGTDALDVLRSLNIIKSYLEHRIDLKQRNNES